MTRPRFDVGKREGMRVQAAAARRTSAIGPVEPRQQRLDIAASRSWRRTRCAGPAARRDGRRCRRRRPRPRAALRAASPAPRCASGGRRWNQSSTTLRQTEVAGADVRIVDQEIDPAACARPSARSPRDWPRTRALQRRQAAERFGPLQPVERILDREHRRRVDGLGLEDAGDELALGGQAENLRQRPGRRVALEPRHRARATAPACRAPPRRPAPSATTRSRHRACPTADPWRRPPRSRRRSPGPCGRRLIQSPFGTRAPEVVPFQVKTTSRSQSTLARSGSSP